MNTSHKDSRSGQAIILLLAVMVIGLLVVLWNFDLHKVISTKVRAMNTGDAAAQSAARWQGTSLNLVGELNLMQAALILSSGAGESEGLSSETGLSIWACSQIRARLVFLGPLMGFFEAQSVAYLNLSQKDISKVGAKYSSELRRISGLFWTGFFGAKEPYPGAFYDYSILLDALAENGVLVECASMVDPVAEANLGSHVLYNQSFYNAVLDRDLCWFVDHGVPGDLRDEDLPELPPPNVENGLYFPLGVHSVTNTLPTLVEEAEVNGEVDELVDDLESDALEYKGVSELLIDFNHDQLISEEYIWHFYDPEKWGMGKDYPFRGGAAVREELNYCGADARVRLAISTDAYTPGISMLTSQIKWGAAAKAFGYLDSDSVGQVVPYYFGMVLPAFHDVRLIPRAYSGFLDDDGSDDDSEIDTEWLIHIYYHLPDYMEDGVEAIEDNACPYCRVLELWENPDYRESIEEWVEKNKENCAYEIVNPNPTGTIDTSGGGGSSDPF